MKLTIVTAVTALAFLPMALLADHHKEGEGETAPTPGGEPPVKTTELEGEPTPKTGEGRPSGRPDGPPPGGRPDGPPPGGRPGGGMGGGALFTEGDADGDGEISKQEFIDFQTKRSEDFFTKADKNEDGKITQEEIMKAMRGMGGMRGGPQGSGRPGGASHQGGGSGGKRPGVGGSGNQGGGGGPKRPGGSGGDEQTEDPLEGLE